MLRRILVISSLFIGVCIHAQLVNGSFENYSSLPLNMGQWQVVEGWGNASSVISSPDYYHYQGAEAADLPETPFAIIDPQQGSALMGLVACGRPNTNTREYLSTQLSSPLLVGRKYLVGLKISNGIKTSTSLAGLGVDQLGLLFSTNPILQNGQAPITESPQLYIESVVYSQDWLSFNFIFIPDQPYKYMSFGLFGDDADKNIEIMEGQDPMFAYYFVDNFSLELVTQDKPVDNATKESPTGDNSNPSVKPSIIPDELFYVPNTFTPNGDGQNEAFIPVSSIQKVWEFEIFSKWGERVFFTADETKGWDGTFNGTNCGNGSYVWQISYMQYEDGQQPKRIEIKGIVNLVR